MRILYVKDKEKFGYYKISAIKPDDFEFGSAEMDSEEFGILNKDLSDDQVNDWANYNKYCVNNTKTNIVETPAEYLFEYVAEIPIEEIIIPEPKGE